MLRQYFPIGTDLSVHSREHLDAVAAQLNGRPRLTLGYDTAAERLATLLAIYNTVEDAANTVVAITQSGVTPAALEMLDGWMVRCVEANVHAGYPEDAAAVLPCSEVLPVLACTSTGSARPLPAMPSSTNKHVNSSYQ